MINGKYVVLYNAMDENKGVFYTLDDSDSKTLSFDTIEEAQAEVRQQVDNDDLSELREVLIVEVVRRGGATTSFLWS